MTKVNKGYVVVANRLEFYYYSALNLISSIKEFDPDAKVCLVSEQKYLDLGGSHIADHILTCDNHPRAKLWGMANTPFDQTFYIDADCEIIHGDLPTVFDLFKDKHVLFTALTDERSYIFAEYEWGNGVSFDWCGAVCLYDMTKPLVKDLMNDWYDLTVKQYSGEWWPSAPDGTPDTVNYPKSLARWDQFSLWWLLNREPKYSDILVGRLDDEYDCRWNNFHGYEWDHCNDKEPVVFHYSNSVPKKESLARSRLR